MDPSKVRELFEQRGRSSGRIDAVTDASPTPEVQRANIYRDFISRRAVLRWVAPQGDERILDYGCGTGRMTMAMASRAREVVGVDVASSMLAQAHGWKAERRVSNVAFVKPEEAQGPFQKAFTFWVLAHHTDTELSQAFVRFSSLLQPGGGLFVFEHVRSVERTLGDVHIQRSHDAYPRFGAMAGFRLNREASVFRMPSYGLKLWKTGMFPKGLLWFLELVERATVNRKREHIEYETRMFEMLKP